MIPRRIWVFPWALAAHLTGHGLALGLASIAWAGEPSWVEVKSAHFTIVSNSSEKSARDVAWEFEQIRAVVEKLWPWARLQADKPIVVFGAKDETTMKELAPEFWERKGGIRPGSVFVSGPDRHYVAVRSDIRGSDQLGYNPYAPAYEPYLRLVFTASFGHPIPLWFSVGLPRLFSNTIVGNQNILLGRIVPREIERLRKGPRIPLRTLLAVDSHSPLYTQAVDREFFDIETTALANFMICGEQGSNAAKLDQYAGMLKAGTMPEVALRETFGDVDSMEKAFLQYVGGPLFGYRKIELAVALRAEGLSARSLSIAESAADRAGFHAAMRRPVEGRALLQTAAEADPSLARAHEIAGLFWDAETKPDEARAEYAKAADLGSDSFYTHYRLAQLTWRPRADHEALSRVDASLERARSLNPEFAFGWSFGAEVKSRLGDGESALALGQHAVLLEPQRSYHHVALARVLWALSKKGAARSEGELGLALAQTPNEKTNAQKFLDSTKGANATAGSPSDPAPVKQ